MKKNKLDTRLDPTGAKQELKYTDYSIERYTQYLTSLGGGANASLWFMFIQ